MTLRGAEPIDPPQFERTQQSVDVSRKGVQSIEVGGELLRVLGRHDRPMLLKDVAKEAGMTAAKAHPYLVSFCKVRLVEQDAMSGHYRLGALALKMGLASIAQSEPIQRAIAALAALSERTQHTAALSVWSQHGPTVIHLSEIDFPLETNLRVGSIMSLLTTATGLVFAAFLPTSITGALINAELARVKGTSRERADLKSKFELTIEQTRTRRMARALGEPLPGVNALSAPVFDQDGSLALVATVLGPQRAFDAKWTGGISKELRDYCSTAARQ